MSTASHLFIGGPCDGQVLHTDPQLPYWKVAIRPKVAPTYGKLPENPYFQTATYERMSLGSHIFYIHEYLTFNDAIGMLLDHYEKKNQIPVDNQFIF